MPTDSSEEKEVEVLYQRALQFLNAGETQNAINFVQAQNVARQLDIIHKIAIVLARDRELSGALALTFDIVLARDLVRDLDDEAEGTSGATRNLDLTLSLTLNLADALADILDHDLAGALADSVARDLDQNMMRVIRSIITGLLNITTLELEPLDTITIDALETQIIPYFKALINLERMIADITGATFTEPVILSIESDSLRGTFRNLTRCIPVLHDNIVAFRHEQAELLDTVKKHKNRVNDGTPAELEAGKKASRELEYETTILTEHILKSIHPNLPIDDKNRYLNQLRATVSVLVESDLEPAS